MSKPRYRWYGYLKNVTRAYPGLVRIRDATHPSRQLSPAEYKEIDAVEYAINITLRNQENGQERIKLIELALFKGIDLEAAACRCYISYTLARQWQRDFVYLIAEYMGLV